MSELIDNSRGRVELLKEIIKELHAGVDPQIVKAKLTTLVQATSSEEIVTMEQQLIADGMSIDEIKGMCDLHQQVTTDLMTEPAHTPMVPGHPVHTFRLENEAIGKVAAEMRKLLLGEIDIPRWRAVHEQLLEVEKHYARKENILFPHLEQHGVLGPSKVMWGKDDDIRAMLRALREALTVEDAGPEEWRVVADQIAMPMLDQVEGMIVKEESILFPLALGKLSPEEWGAIWSDSQRFGFCLVAPGAQYTPAGAPPAAATDHGSVRVGAGSLTLAQLTAVFETLPVDLTLVDADDRVAFFSEGKHRVFDRSQAIIGRLVQNCHPPHSVEIVEKILADFKSGAQDLAEFWIEMRGRFVHIQYYALRGAQGEYLGTLEVTQDTTHVRSLAGERRLLQYEGATS
jgi:uncharacterized protein